MNEKQEKYIKKIISRNLAIEWGKQKKKKIPWWNLWDKLVMDIWIARYK